MVRDAEAESERRTSGLRELMTSARTRLRAYQVGARLSEIGASARFVNGGEKHGPRCDRRRPQAIKGGVTAGTAAVPQPPT